MDFTCNICGTRNSAAGPLSREAATCSGCRSPIRLRALLAALSRELFGVPLKLIDFPVLKTLRGLGLSDESCYADVLAARFDYRNTYFDRPPQLDITALNGSESANLDFLLAAEVFEHVRPPVERAFQNAMALLKPEGVLLMTVPYKPAGATEEHFPDLYDYGTLTLRGGTVLVNRTPEGAFQVFPDLRFHGGTGSTLEMRCFSEAGLRQTLAAAGFGYVRIYAEDLPEYGIVHNESWSLPIAARRNLPNNNLERQSELAARYGELSERKRDLQTDLDRHRAWVRNLQQELADTQAAVRSSQQENRRLEDELNQRTVWARDLEAKLADEINQKAALVTELEKRTAWSRGLEFELEEKVKWGAALDAELRSRTEWAQDLERQLNERTGWALQLQAQVKALEADLRRIEKRLWYRIGKLLRPLRLR